MQKQHSPVEEDNGMIEISISDLIATIWRGRWIVIFVTAVVAAISLLVVLQTAKYESEGLFQFGGSIPIDGSNEPGIAFADYKRIAASFQTSERFEEYVRDSKLTEAPGISNLRKTISSRGGISKLVEPIYTFTQADAKTLISPKDNLNNVIGLRISIRDSDALTAQNMVALMGRYSMDTIIYSVYESNLLEALNQYSSKIIELDNKILQMEETQNESLRKIAALQAIIAKYPAVAGQQAGQVISITDDTVRYLSPVTQMVSIEIQIADTNAKLARLNRDKQQTLLMQDYYTRAQKLLNSTKSGEVLLYEMDLIHSEVFKDRNLKDDVVKEVYNLLKIANQNAISVYLQRSRFVAGPTLPTVSTARPLLALAGGLLAGFFLSLIIVFSREWWRNSQTKTQN